MKAASDMQPRGPSGWLLVPSSPAHLRRHQQTRRPIRGWRLQGRERRAHEAAAGLGRRSQQGVGGRGGLPEGAADPVGSSRVELSGGRVRLG
eukprot:1856540-Prymnesium_polylepis.1